MLPTWLKNNGTRPNMTVEDAAHESSRSSPRSSAPSTRPTRSVSRAESIRKFVILPTDFTEASGHLTPKLSIKRNVILKDFAPDIEALYSAAPATQGISLAH